MKYDWILPPPLPLGVKFWKSKKKKKSAKVGNFTFAPTLVSNGIGQIVPGTGKLTAIQEDKKHT